MAVTPKQIQSLIRNTNKNIGRALRDLEHKAQTGKLAHQQLTVANVDFRETIQLFLIAHRVLIEVMPVMNEIGTRLQNQLKLQDTIEGHSFEEMENLQKAVYEFRNLATLSNNLCEALESRLKDE